MTLVNLAKGLVRKIPPLHHLARRIDQRLYQHYAARFATSNGNGVAGPVQPAQTNAQLKTAEPIIEKNLYLQFAPAGHYYSTIPSQDELAAEKERIFSTALRPLPGIVIPDEAMLKLLAQFAPLYNDFPFTKPGYRFSMPNGVFDWGEAVILYSIMRVFKPARIIEVGSGFSSALMLDISEHFLEAPRLTFIDPYTERLQTLVSKKDANKVTIHPRRLQDVDSDMFKELEANDIAFFDSTHVSKCDSDVNHIFFDVLPKLKPGVLIHFHDVFYPFEYPERWLLEVGAAWNEDYLLRAFLQYNDSFEILFFNDYMTRFHNTAVQQAFNRSQQWLGSSIWLRKK